MKTRSLFLGIGLIAFGILLSLDSLGILSFDLAQLVFPLLLILAGIWVIWGVSGARHSSGVMRVRIPLEGAGNLKLRLRHGIGRLRVDATLGMVDTLAAELGFAALQEIQREGQSLIVRLGPRDDWFFLSAPWGWSRGEAPDWRVHLPTSAAVGLDLDTGASEADLDLTGVRLTSLRLRTGASSLDLRLPCPEGNVPVMVQGAATAIRLKLDPAAAARVTAHADLGTASLDPMRFTSQDGLRATVGFAQAADRYEIEARVIAGTLEIR